MEKIRKIDVGTLLANDSHSEFEFEDSIRKRSYMVFENGGHFDDSSRTYELNGEHCYIVSKDDLDAYMAHKESLEKTKGTPEWYLSNRIKQLEGELTEIKTARTLREAYITGVEKGCESLREERDRWKSRCNSVMTDISKSLAANGIEFKLKENDGEATWVFVIDIPELNEAKKKVEDLEKQVVQMIVKVSDTKHEYNKKWQAMLDALKDKGVEVIYMGEQDGKPCVDVKIPEIDILKKELEALKSRTLDNVEIRLSCGDIVWTYCDGFVQVSSGISGIITADEIVTGTVPKCSSCSHFMHNPSRFAHDWCYMPCPKEGGAGYIRKLNKEEAEGPACSDFKARKE